MAKVTFICVKTPPAKLACITSIASYYFSLNHALAILVEDTKALHFVDELLWRHPLESFLPHPTQLLSISLQVAEDTGVVLNLKPAPLLEGSFYNIYEMEDYTSSEKLQLSKQRYEAYKKAGYTVVLAENATSLFEKS